ncbi:hypothetical protein AOQ84DRAFT_300565 [Glonium stellatum]|uniref:DUF7580 domain-containing protein n=1 Tax=Glonium stellatum TaxID=574774 RepID=A0A8E2ETJ5_9PEZI|nr:hypothetical protein AOQ84DRAFT_300565 [Glonium stellatum]
MSGVEVAGFLLAAFPLLISALEHYREGAELLSDWWRIQRAYKKCKQDIEYHQILFESNVEEFLLPLVVNEAELQILMENPAGEGWEDPELEERLKQRLPKSYNLYLDIIGDINKLMEKLKKELGVGNAYFQSRVNESKGSTETKIYQRDLLSVSNVQFQAKRITFSLKKSSRAKLFRELKECNDRMRKLLESSDRTSAAKHVQRISNQHLAHTKLTQFWCHAEKLHHALSRAFQCACKSHKANLRLQHRTTEEAEFDLLFSMKTTPDSWGWQETKIKMLHNEPLSEAMAIKVTATENMSPSLATPQHRIMKSTRSSALNKAERNASLQCVPNR